MRSMSIRSVFFGVVLASVAGVGCAASRSDFVVALPNGYQIVRDKTSAPTLVKKKGGVVVPGPVARYTVIRDVVVGQVDRSAQTKDKARDPAKDQTSSPAKDKPADKAAENDTPAEKTAGEKQGFFVLDTRSGQLGTQLSESAFNERLKSLNIPPSPELSPPVLPE